MVIGKLKEIVPYFDIENNAFINYDVIPKAGFSEDPERYFFDRHEGESFEIESWLDIIVAPYFIENTGQSQVRYSQLLIDLFRRLFPDIATYVKYIQLQSERLLSYLNDLKSNNADKNSIISSVEELQLRTTRVSKLLNQLQAKFPENEYLISSLSAIENFNKKLTDFSDRLYLESENQIKYEYYSRRPGISWEEAPLGFFGNILYGNGIENIQKEIKEDEEKYGNIDSIDKYYERLYRSEFYKSLKLFVVNLSKRKSKASKQEYANAICRQVSILFNKSSHSLIKDHYPDHLRPYQSLIRSLQEQYKSLTFNVGFSCEKEEELRLVETTKFQKALLSLRIKDKEGRERSLFKGHVSVLQLGLLITGDTDNMPVVQFDWENETVHYLLYRLGENGASFIVSRLSKKAFTRDGTAFKAGGHYTFKSEYIAGIIKRNEAFDQIDSLFS